MEVVQLRFPSIDQLWEFKQLLKTSTFGVDTSTLTLKCDCSKEEIEEAIKNFGAVVV